MYKLLVYSDELYHYGVMGMRWGVRRYQNYDGTKIKGGPVTNPRHAGHPQGIRNTVVGGQGGKAKGNEQLAATANKKPKAKDVAEKLATPSVKQGKGREDISPAEDITKKAKRVAESGERIAEFGEKHDKSVQQRNEEARQKQMNKAKKMSDKELRDSINRIKMEREYTSLTTKEVESGWTKAKDILSVSKEVLEITGAIVGIIASIMAIKKGMGMKQSDISEDVDELNRLLGLYEFDDDFIAHAMDLDEQYLMAAYDISEEDVDYYLEHHGVKGMKWGIRRYQNYDGTRIGTGSGPVTKTGDRIARKKSEQKSSTKAFDKKISRLERTGADPSRIDRKRAERDQVDRAYNKKISRLESKQVAEQKTIEDRIARKKAERDQAIKPFDNKISRLERNGADKDRIDRKKDEREQVAKSFDKKIDSLVKKYENVKLDQLAAYAKKPKVRADGKDESKFTPQQKRTSNDARKDAEEFARAKAFYGEGAGNRRKAIKTTVEAKKKKDSFYAEEFEYHLSQQDKEKQLKRR